MSSPEEPLREAASSDEFGFEFPRRALLKAAGIAGAASVLATPVAADHRSKGRASHLDPLWGLSGIHEEFLTTGEFPPLNAFPPQIRPDHVVELHIDFDPANGEFDGFHFHPAGLWVTPGDIVLFVFPSPDHTISAYSPGFGRQKRVPGDVGPFSSPLLPIGGWWLYRFGEEGVYDFLCAPHEILGMVGRIVAWDGTGDVPSDEFAPGGRPPEEINILNFVVEVGFSPVPLPITYPSAHEVLESDALAATAIVAATDGEVHWSDVLAEFNPGSPFV